MPRPFEIDETKVLRKKDGGTAQSSSPREQFFRNYPAPTVQDVMDGIVRETTSLLTRQQSRSQTQLEDLQTDAVHKWRDFYLRLLPIMDGLDLIISQMDPSSELGVVASAVRTQFLTLLEYENIIPVEISPGQMFEPKFCEAIDRQERADLEPGTIISVDSRGYLWRSNVLRFARVVVSEKLKGG